MLVDSQQLIVFHVFTRSWASVCVSYFFVPVETGAPPFFRKNYLFYIGIWRGIVKRPCRLRYNFPLLWRYISFDGVENARVGARSRGVITGAGRRTGPHSYGDTASTRARFSKTTSVRRARSGRGYQSFG